MPVHVSKNLRVSCFDGPICVRQSGLPRYWSVIWIDVIKASRGATTKRRYIVALHQLYESVHRQHGNDCLDRLISDLDFDAIEHCLIGFLAQLRNAAAVAGVDRTSIWKSALSFVTDIIRLSGRDSGRQIAEIEANLLRLDALFRTIAPNGKRKSPSVRALPASVIEELYEIFKPDSLRNPFKTEELRWRNLLIFMVLLRFGLRRGEAALLHCNSFKEDFDPVSGEIVHWLDVEETNDFDPRYEKPGHKTGNSQRQLPPSRDLLELAQLYIQNYRGRVNFPHLFISQKVKPLSLRAFNEIFETVTKCLSEEAKDALKKQGLKSVSCHDLRHTAAVVRMKRYQEAGFNLDMAQEKLRSYFGWSRGSNMPILYAKAFFDTHLAEVWGEKFDNFVGALRRVIPEAAR